MKARRWPSSSRRCKAAGVERVIDVRALPLSRRPGFSKTPLRGALEEAGIEYVHLKALGTPAEGRSGGAGGAACATSSGSMPASSSCPKRWRKSAQMLELARGKAERAAVLRARARALPSHACCSNAVAAGRRGRSTSTPDLRRDQHQEPRRRWPVSAAQQSQKRETSR